MARDVNDRIRCLGDCFRGSGGIRRFHMSGVCLCWHLTNGEIAKVTDEERQKLCEALRRRAELGPVRVPMCSEAADEIERLAAENERLQNELRLWKEQG
jgi:hypothetical protein